LKQVLVQNLSSSNWQATISTETCASIQLQSSATEELFDPII
jgi:hypothetical protein